MNRQKPPHGIEWTRINGRPGYTWKSDGGLPARLHLAHAGRLNH